MQNGSWTVVAFIAAFTFSVFSRAGAEETLEPQSFPPVQQQESKQPTTAKTCTPDCDEKYDSCHKVVEKALMLMKTPGRIIIQEEEEEPLLLHSGRIAAKGIRACGCRLSSCNCNTSQATPELKPVHATKTYSSNIRTADQFSVGETVTSNGEGQVEVPENTLLPATRVVDVSDDSTATLKVGESRKMDGITLLPAVRQASFELEEGEVVRNITDQVTTVSEPTDTEAPNDTEKLPRVKELIRQLATRSQHNRATLNVPVPSETVPPLRIDFKGKENEQAAQPSSTQPQTCPCQHDECRWKVVETASANEGCPKTCGYACAKSCSGVCCESNCEPSATPTNSELITICSEIESFDEYVAAMAMIVESASRNSQQADLNKALVALATAKMQTMIHAVEMESEVRQAIHESELEVAKLEAVVEANEAILELTSESLQLLMATGTVRRASFPQNYIPSALPRVPVPTNSIPPMIRPSAYNQIGPVTTWNAQPEYGFPTPYAPQTRVANLPPAPANPPTNPAVHTPTSRSSMPIHQSEEEARAFSFNMGFER